MVTVTAFDSVGAQTTATFMLTVTTPATCNPVSFAPAAPFGVGSSPEVLAVGDFNGDGHQDLAVANPGSNNVSVLLGNGAGGFSASTNFGVGLTPKTVAVGDFNADGEQDLAVANFSSHNVSILLGNGTGGFNTHGNFSVVSTPGGVAVGDFNSDGKQDLAVANVSANNVSVLLGDGTGSFSASTNYGAGGFPGIVVVGDFNHDGKQDLAVCNNNSSNVSVLLGNGSGGFGTATNFGVGASPETLALGDFNGDGIQDLATANFAVNSGTVSVLLGNGAGGFSAPANFVVGSGPITVAVGDFNGDGKQDLAVTNQNTNDVSVLLGNGAGGFGSATNFGASINPRGVVVGDFNGDGKQDLAATNLNSASVSVLLRQCPAMPGDLLISEFRLRGPGGANDEYVEIYNNTDSPHTVRTTDGSAGYAIVSDDGIKRCTIPANVTIPAHGHFLCVNGNGYGLGAYPAGVGTTASGDATYLGDIPDNSGLALFNSATDFSLSTRLDAVGFTTSSTLYKEGVGLPLLTSLSTDYAFVRDECGKSGSITTFGPCPSGGSVVDSPENAADFIFVDTGGVSAGAGQRLGAPGPQNLSSPIQRNGNFTAALLDPCTSSSLPPNRVRSTVATPDYPFGTLEIRRTLTNTTIPSATRLRFRIIDITTYPAPSGIADLRALTSSDVMVIVSQCGSAPSSVLVRGTTLEEPPSQPNGGAFNSSLSVIPLAPPLPLGGSISVRFLFGLKQTGLFKFYVNIEALP